MSLQSRGIYLTHEPKTKLCDQWMGNSASRSKRISLVHIHTYTYTDRSANTAEHVIPLSKHSTMSDSAFPVAAVRIWNSLPPFASSSCHCHLFKQSLKTELFKFLYLTAERWKIFLTLSRSPLLFFFVSWPCSSLELYALVNGSNNNYDGITALVYESS